MHVTRIQIYLPAMLNAARVPWDPMGKTVPWQ